MESLPNGKFKKISEYIGDNGEKIIVVKPISTYSQEYYEKNKEKMRETNKKFHNQMYQNSEEYRQRKKDLARAYYERNKERIIAKNSQRNKERREKQQESS